MKYIVKQIARKAFGRRIVAGDVHGCHNLLKRLLEDRVKLTKDDQLFLLGDLINKGDNSALVLDYLQELISKGFEIYPIKGNHEEKLLMAYGCGFEFFEDYLRAYNSLDLLNRNLHEYLDFISEFEYCIELDEFFLSHAGIGINDTIVDPSTDLRGMFPNVDFGDIDWQSLIEKQQVHGHQTVSLQTIKKDLKDKKRRISIDAGCENSGDLVALDLDTLKLY